MSAAIAANVALVRERIASACKRAGREPETIRLIAISKTMPAERIRAAFEVGLREFGENRVQEAETKRPGLADLPITWHMVGHLQTNKARSARNLFDWIQSIDSLRLAQKLDAVASAGQKRLPVLIEVNLAGEESKSGVSAAALPELVGAVATLGSLEVRGLMTVPPYIEDLVQVRPYFKQLRKLAAEIESRGLPNVSMRELSMGMSHDFEVAIEEGATMVRVGTAIFGARKAI